MHNEEMFGFDAGEAQKMVEKASPKLIGKGTRNFCRPLIFSDNKNVAVAVWIQDDGEVVNATSWVVWKTHGGELRMQYGQELSYFKGSVSVRLPKDNVTISVNGDKAVIRYATENFFGVAKTIELADLSK